MIYTCMLCTFIPILNNSFTLFTTSYHRWHYMMILIYSLASSIVLERRSEFPVNKITLLLFSSLLSCFIIFIFIWDKYKYQTIFNMKAFVLLSVVTLLRLLLLGAINKIPPIENNRYYFVIMLALVSIFTATNFHSLQEYKNYRNDDATQYYSKIRAFSQITSVKMDIAYPQMKMIQQI